MSAIALPVLLLASLGPLLLAGLIVYGAVRFGVRHGMRDAERRLPPPPAPPSPGTGPDGT